MLSNSEDTNTSDKFNSYLVSGQFQLNYLTHTVSFSVNLC